MKGLSVFFWMFPFLGGFLFAGNSSETLVQNGGFENGPAHWRIQKGSDVEIKRGYGRNDSSGIRIKLKYKERSTVLQTLNDIERNQKYLITAWIKADKSVSAGITLDVYKKNGEYLRGGGAYHGGEVNGKDWTFYRQVYHQKGEIPEDHKYELILLCRGVGKQIGRGASPVVDSAPGFAFYDDVMFVKDIPAWNLTQIYPTHQSVSSDGGVVILSNFYEHGFIPPESVPAVSAELKRPGDEGKRELDAKFLPGRLAVSIPPSEAGPASLKITLHDLKTGKVYGEKILPLLIRKGSAPPANACIVDQSGRALVNNKPFMPLGVYCAIREDGLSESWLSLLDKISGAKVFNCFMAYGLSFHIRSDKELIRFLDLAEERKLKVMAGIGDFLRGGPMGDYRQGVRDPAELEVRVKRIIEMIKDHPALLAYYIDDETPVGELGKTILGRSMTNRFDPFHPAWGVSYQVEAFESYLPAVDVLAYDSYPIRKNVGNNFITRWFAERAQSLTDMIWAVPQCYQADELVLNTENMMSVCAVEIMHGAKGFLFYSVSTGFDKGSMNERWPALVETGRILKGLEPFIMSGQPARTLQTKDEKDRVIGNLLSDGKGNFRVVAAGVLNRHQSEIFIPKEFRLVSSRFGHLKETAPGILRYEGGALSCDVGVLARRGNTGGVSP